MQINKIVKMKDNKYKIFIDGDNIITYDNVILENDLLYKKSIDNKLYNKIINDTKYYDIYNKAVKYILKRRRSEKEVRIYLSKLDIDNSKVNDIVNKLKDIKLINDIEYSKAYINDKIYLGKVGINKIKRDLLEQNIPEITINDLLEDIDTDILNSRLETMILKKIKANNKYSNHYLKQKILNEFVNMGYNKESIIDILNTNINDDNNILKNEFNKIYNTLSKKYSGYELSNKIKQKLIFKGFRVENINILLQEKTED